MDNYFIKVAYGDVFIRQDENEEWQFVAQLCFDPESVGFAIANYLSGKGAEDD